MLVLNVKTIKAQLLLAAMHMLHLFIPTFQTSIKLVSVITQNEEKEVSFSRMEGAKVEKGIGLFTMLSY